MAVVLSLAFIQKKTEKAENPINSRQNEKKIIMKRKSKPLKRAITVITLLIVLVLSFTNCEDSKSKTNKDKSTSDVVLKDSIDVTLGAFTLKVPSAWQSFDQSEISNLNSQYQEQSKQIYQQYAATEDGSQSVDLAAYHISKDAGTFVLVSLTVPPQSDLIKLLKSQIGDKMEWGIREGYIKKYLGIVEIENEQFSGFYTKAIGKTGKIEISGGLNHKKLKNTIIQLTLLCPEGWDSTKATNTMDVLLKTVILKNN